MKNNRLRIAWIIPNIFCYCFALGCTFFVLKYAEELAEVNRLFVWIAFLLGLYTVSIMGSLKIKSWIIDGKM